MELSPLGVAAPRRASKTNITRTSRAALTLSLRPAIAGARIVGATPAANTAVSPAADNTIERRVPKLAASAHQWQDTDPVVGALLERLWVNRCAV